MNSINYKKKKSSTVRNICSLSYFDFITFVLFIVLLLLNISFLLNMRGTKKNVPAVACFLVLVYPL